MQTRSQLDRLEREFFPAFLGYAINRLHHLDEAEELAQEIACRATAAIRAGRTQSVDLDAYLWTLARNTFLDHIRRRNRAPMGETAMLGLAADTPSPEENVIDDEERAEIRLAVSRLWGNYRRVIVARYYADKPIDAIADELGLSVQMVKFYLRAGKEKLKEGLTMIGETSITPKSLTVYRTGGWSTVNVWQLLMRKLPGQIAILCHNAAKTVTELSRETGTPAVYLEEEIDILLGAGLLIRSGKDRYRTNFHILDGDAMQRFDATFRQLFAKFVPHVADAFARHLPALRETDAFDHPVDDDRYRWLWAKMIRNWSSPLPDGGEYPRLLSDGCEAYVYAAISEKPRWGHGQSYIDAPDGGCIVPVDFTAFGPYHHQIDLNCDNAAPMLYRVARGQSDGSDDPVLAARLVEQGYLTHAEGRLCANVMRETPAVRAFFKPVNDELKPILTALCGDTAELIRSIVRQTIPQQLRAYADGFTRIWIGTLAGNYFYEALADAGFLTVPESPNLPVACFVYVKSSS